MRLPQAQSHSPYAGTSCPLGQKRTSAEICRQRDRSTADFKSVLPPTHAVPIDQNTKRRTVSSNPIIVRSSLTHRNRRLMPVGTGGVLRLNQTVPRIWCSRA